MFDLPKTALQNNISHKTKHVEKGAKM